MLASVAKWGGALTGNKLREIKESVYPWGSSIRGTRQEEVDVTRLRTGHSHLTHGYQMSRQQPPLCDPCSLWDQWCPARDQTYSYIMSKIQEPKESHKIPLTVKETLADVYSAVNGVLRYLKATSLFKTIWFLDWVLLVLCFCSPCYFVFCILLMFMVFSLFCIIYNLNCLFFGFFVCCFVRSILFYRLVYFV